MDREEELKILANTIIDSYDFRVLAVKKLMIKAQQSLVDFREELEQIVGQVRSNLAKSENLRRKDFDAMIKDLIELNHFNEKEAEKSLVQFYKEEQEMINLLRSMISNKNCSGIKEIEAISEDIMIRQKRRERNIVGNLKNYNIYFEEFKTGLEKLLNKGEDIKIKDFKTVLKAVKVQQCSDYKGINSILDGFDLIRTSVQEQWKSVS